MASLCDVRLFSNLCNGQPYSRTSSSIISSGSGSQSNLVSSKRPSSWSSLLTSLLAPSASSFSKEAVESVTSPRVPSHITASVYSAGKSTLGADGSLRSTLCSLKNTIKTVRLLALFAVTTVVEAHAPEAAETGPADALKSKDPSDLAFGLITSIGVFFTIIAVIIAYMQCRKRQGTNTPVRLSIHYTMPMRELGETRFKHAVRIYN